MHKQRLLIVVAAVVGIISIFLPWIRMSAHVFGDYYAGSENGFQGAGIVVFFCFLAAAVMPFIGNKMQVLDKTWWLLTLIAGALAFLFTLVFIIKEIGNMGYVGGGSEKVYFGFGQWMAFIAAAGIVLSAWLLKSPEHTLKTGFENLTNQFSIPTTTVTTTEAPIHPPSATINQTVADEQTKTNISSSQEILNELERLAKMKNDGIITEEEFQQLKSKLLHS